MVHPGGRPRIKNLYESKEECIALGKELVKWATEPTTEWRCLMGQFYCMKKGILRHEWKAILQRKEFLPYYQTAQQALAVKALDGTMEKSFGHRYIRLYDRELIEAENEQARIDADLKKTSEPEKAINLTIKNYSDKTK